jgi:hypothetical protein
MHALPRWRCGFAHAHLRLLRLILPATLAALAACGGGSAGDAPDAALAAHDAAPPPADAGADAVPGPFGPPFNYVADLPRGEAARARLCALPRDDRFRRWYCAGASAPTVDGVAALLAGVQLGEDGFPEAGDGDRFAALAHSTALSPLDATPLNLRVVFFSKFAEAEFATLLYTRGEHVAELAMRDLVHDTIDFYLVVFQLACGGACSEADLHLDGADAGWRDVSVYAEDDLRNTPLDCLRCHEPGGRDAAGHDGARILRMHELRAPWTHWLGPGLIEVPVVYGSTMLQGWLFQSRSLDATYASVPVMRLAREGSAIALENFLERAGFSDQPNRYDGLDINQDDAEVSVPSPAWLTLYDAAEQGKSIDAPPHFAILPFARDRLDAASASYRAVASGQAPASTMPSVTRGLWDDVALRTIGYRPGPGLDAKGMVQHVCGPCHDGRFPGQSRDRFRASNFPAGLTPELRTLVTARLVLGHDDAQLMPPVIAGELDATEIQQIQAALAAP